MSIKTVCTIEARMTSSRLPGKVLAPACGTPLLAHMVQRLRRCTAVDEIVVATTVNVDDDPIEALADDLAVGCFRGSEDDVLGRVLGAARAHDADLIVETSADCPLIDPAIVGQVLARFHDGGVDYCSNTVKRTYPRGMDVQVFPTSVLGEVDQLTTDPADREHVSLYIYEHPDRYRLGQLVAEPPLEPELRLTVDWAEDLELVRAVFEALYPRDHGFGLPDILTLLAENPELRELNAHLTQKPVR